MSERARRRRGERVAASLGKPRNNVMAHGICRICLRRRIVWLPLRVCERCLDG